MIGFVNHVNRRETCRKNDGTRAYSPKTRTSEATGLDFQLSTVVFFFNLISRRYNFHVTLVESAKGARSAGCCCYI